MCLKYERVHEEVVFVCTSGALHFEAVHSVFATGRMPPLDDAEGVHWPHRELRMHHGAVYRAARS